MKKEIRRKIEKEVKDFLVMFFIIFAIPLTIAEILFTVQAFIATVIISVMLFFIFCMTIVRIENRKEKRRRNRA